MELYAGLYIALYVTINATTIILLSFVYFKTKNRVGIKVSGGVSSVEDAVKYYTIVKEILGKEWLSPTLFRIGTSRLANILLKEITD